MDGVLLLSEPVREGLPASRDAVQPVISADRSPPCVTYPTPYTGKVPSSKDSSHVRYRSRHP